MADERIDMQTYGIMPSERAAEQMKPFMDQVCAFVQGSPGYEFYSWGDSGPRFVVRETYADADAYQDISTRFVEMMASSGADDGTMSMSPERAEVIATAAALESCAEKFARFNAHLYERIATVEHGSGVDDAEVGVTVHWVAKAGHEEQVRAAIREAKTILEGIEGIRRATWGERGGNQFLFMARYADDEAVRTSVAATAELNQVMFTEHCILDRCDCFGNEASVENLKDIRDQWKGVPFVTAGILCGSSA